MKEPQTDFTDKLTGFLQMQLHRRTARKYMKRAHEWLSNPLNRILTKPNKARIHASLCDRINGAAIASR
jgi:hypothetical protein